MSDTVRILDSGMSPMSKSLPGFKTEGNQQFISWYKPVITEFEGHLSSNFLNGITYASSQQEARSYRKFLMLNYFEKYCQASALYPELLNYVDIKNSSKSRTREYEDLSIDEQLLFEFMARLDLVATGIMPLDRYSTQTGSEYKDNHERLNIQEAKSACKLDWQQVYLKTTDDFYKTKGDLPSAIPFILKNAYEDLKRHNINPKKALHIIISSLPPIYTEGGDNYKYWEKIIYLNKFKDIITNDYEKRELEELISYYSSTGTYFYR